MKPKAEPIHELMDAAPSASQSSPQAAEYRREQSLDYVPQHPAPSQTSTVLSSSAPSHLQEGDAAGSPAVPLSEHTSAPANPSRTPSRAPAQPPRELPETSLAPISSTQPPAQPAPPPPSATVSPAQVARRRGPVTPPRELAPSALSDGPRAEREQQTLVLDVQPHIPQATPVVGHRLDSATVQQGRPPVPGLPSRPPERHASENRRQAQDHQGGVVWSNEDHVRHKRARDHDPDVQQQSTRRRRLTPPAHEHDTHPPPRDQLAPPSSSRSDRHPFPPPPTEVQQSRPQDLVYRMQPPPRPAPRGYDSYVPDQARGRSPPSRGRSPPPVNRYAPAGSAATEYIPHTEAQSSSQMAGSLRGRVQSAAHAVPFAEPAPRAQDVPPGPRLPESVPQAPPPRRKAQRRTPPQAELPPPEAPVEIALLGRLTEPKEHHAQQGAASRGRGSGRGRGAGRGGGRGRGRGRGEPQKPPPLGERIRSAKTGALLDRIK